MKEKLRFDDAVRIGALVGCDGNSVIEILEGWTGQPLSEMNNQEIAREITARLDDFAENP